MDVGRLAGAHSWDQWFDDTEEFRCPLTDGSGIADGSATFSLLPFFMVILKMCGVVLGSQQCVQISEVEVTMRGVSRLAHSRNACLLGRRTQKFSAARSAFPVF